MFHIAKNNILIYAITNDITGTLIKFQNHSIKLHAKD